MHWQREIGAGQSWSCARWMNYQKLSSVLAKKNSFFCKKTQLIGAKNGKNDMLIKQKHNFAIKNSVFSMKTENIVKNLQKIQLHLLKTKWAFCHENLVSGG